MDAVPQSIPGNDVLDLRDIKGRALAIHAQYPEWDDEDVAYLIAVRDLFDQFYNGSERWEWPDGDSPILIREDYFPDYAEELASDVGAISGTEEWPLMFIDWDAASEALKMDYSEVEFFGTTYLHR